MAKRLTVEKVLDVGAHDGEGPFWIESEQRLGWVDIAKGRLHRFDPASGDDEVIDVGQPLSAAVSRRGGGFALAVQRGFALMDPDLSRAALVAEIDDDSGKLRFNDGKVDPQGRFWAGSMAYDHTHGAGSLYRLDPDRTVTKMVSGVTISNGLDWSPDGKTMYFIDTLTWKVDAFDFDGDSGAIGERRTLMEVPNDTSSPEGVTAPDGMTVDSKGSLWIAIFGSGEVRQYSPDGEPEAVVELPVLAVTSCAFGGRDYSELYITTMVTGDRDASGGEGALYRCIPDVRGRPPFVFDG